MTVSKLQYFDWIPEADQICCPFNIGLVPGSPLVSGCVLCVIMFFIRVTCEVSSCLWGVIGDAGVQGAHTSLVVG